MRRLVRWYLEREAGWELWSAIIAEEPHLKQRHFHRHNTLQHAAVILRG